MTTHWSLARTQLSNFLVDDAMKEAAGKIDDDLEEQLRSAVETKQAFKALGQAVKQAKPLVSDFTAEALQEELDEIKEDLHWIGTARGKYVIAINDWVQPFHAEFNAVDRFKDVMIGGHSEREVVFATGAVETREDYDALLKFISSKEPPFKVMTKIWIRSEEATPPW